MEGKQSLREAFLVTQPTNALNLWLTEGGAYEFSLNSVKHFAVSKDELMTSDPECQRKAMPQNAQTTAQLHSSHTLVK